MNDLYIKGIKVSCCTIDSSVTETISNITSQNKNYICVTDAGNLVNAHRKSPGLRSAINNSLLSLPDGRPISLIAKFKGIKDIDRVAGPDFMQAMFKETSGTKIKHFFLGDTEDVLKELVEKVTKEYDVQIAGTLSPAFEERTKETEEEIISKINSSDADLIWVAFGGGRQEIWMMNNYAKLDKGIMVGVGAAFRFYLGKIKRAPVIFQKLGLEWMFRLVQQPRKMFKRYITTLPYFILYSIQLIPKNNSNLKSDKH